MESPEKSENSTWVAPSDIISNLFLEDLEKIWELKKWIPDPCNPYLHYLKHLGEYIKGIVSGLLSPATIIIDNLMALSLENLTGKAVNEFFRDLKKIQRGSEHTITFVVVDHLGKTPEGVVDDDEEEEAPEEDGRGRLWTDKDTARLVELAATLETPDKETIGLMMERHPNLIYRKAKLYGIQLMSKPRGRKPKQKPEPDEQ